METELNCTVLEAGKLMCSDGFEYLEYEPPLSPSQAAFWVCVGISVFLVLTAGLMSGLTIGLVSMDTTTLAVLSRSGTPKESRQAHKLLPLVSRHHLLLVTLLLANAICMEALPIFLDRLVSPVAAIGISVTAVLFFGEIIPQALCTRYGLAIGANLVYLVWTIIFVFFPIAWPISLLLDWLLGHASGRYYRRRELLELVRLHEIHVEDNAEPLHADEVQLIEGALEFTTLAVRDALTPLDAVVSVASDATVDDALVATLVRAGHSRVPVHAPGRPSAFVGVLLTKSLLGRPLHNPDAPVLVRDLPLRPVMEVDPALPLYDLLHHFETGRCHLAVVVESATSTSELLLGTDGVRGEKAGLLHDTAFATPTPSVAVWAPPMPAGGDLPRLPTGDKTHLGDPAASTSTSPWSPMASGRALGIVTMEDVIEALLRNEIQDEAELDRLQRQLAADEHAGLPRRSFRPRAATRARADTAQSQSQSQTPSRARAPSVSYFVGPTAGPSAPASAAAAPASPGRPWTSYLRFPWRRRYGNGSSSLTTSLLSVAPEYHAVPHDSRDRSASAESGGGNDYPVNSGVL